MDMKEYGKYIKDEIQLLVNENPEGENKEMCGVVILTPDGIEARSVSNLSKTEEVHYAMCPKELGEKVDDTDFLGGENKNVFLGVWHTHPFHDSNPSSIDINNMLLNRWYFIYSVVNGDLTMFKKDKVF